MTLYLGMFTLTGKTRAAFLCFFLSHVPITILIDGQAFLPKSWYPRQLQEVLQWYAATFRDSLMMKATQDEGGASDVWFTSLVGIELILQLPFFVYSVYVLTSTNREESRWTRGDGVFRSLCMIYGSVTCTTLVPIFASIHADPATTAMEKAVLGGFYFPYFVFPFWLVLIAASSENVFGRTRSKDFKVG